LPSVPADAASETALERDAWPRKDPHISDILYQLGDKVRLAWIPSHTGSIAPSDLVDKRAKDARHHGVSVSCPAPRAHTASLLKRASERECAARKCQLREAETPRHRAIRCPGVARPQWVHPNGTLGQFSISKKRIKALERLLS
ncbi:hypothetical protein FOZ63_008612, partial [Perkinsus olseni]